MRPLRCLLVLLGCCLLGSWLSAADAPAPAPEPGTPAFFSDRIKPLLQDQCLRCHSEIRQKGGLRLDDRADILKGGEHGPAMVVGDPGKSLLITAVRYQDQDLQMPPDDRLTDAQIADLAAWIANGSVWVHGDGRVEGGAVVAQTTGSGTGTTTGVPEKTTPSTTPAEDGGKKRPPLIGRPHPLVIHFPIACLLLALLAEFFVVARGPAWQPTVGLLVTVGIIGAAVAVITGSFFADGSVFHRPGRTLATHELLGWLSLVLSLATGALLMASRTSPRARLFFRLALVATAIAIGLTGHFGGMMSHPESEPF